MNITFRPGWFLGGVYAMSVLTLIAWKLSRQEVIDAFDKTTTPREKFISSEAE